MYKVSYVIEHSIGCPLKHCVSLPWLACVGTNYVCACCDILHIQSNSLGANDAVADVTDNRKPLAKLNHLATWA